eukprot:TRINITY_DN25891_c0_g1_i1.p1 TRINITY_DN25891_c0_g1~~TRINITY_DN25891_c0_g1_i1.p1  ORF type:complete len:302 (-),score=60.81 TRINITY_DN25891_c0_g1_i1:37-942(-)
MGDLVQFLKEKKIGEVTGINPALIQAKTTTNAFEGYLLLIDNNILSLPLYDETVKNYTSFLDIMDVLHFLTHSSEGKTNKERLEHTTCGALANFSKLDPFIRITANTNLIKVLQISSQDYKSLHRFPVVDEVTGNLESIVSQSALVRFLEPHTKSFDFGTLSIGIIGLGLDKKVLTVSEQDSVEVAVQKIKQHQVSGLGIVDKDGKLVGNFDPTGIKYFGTNQVLDMAKTTMADFMKSMNVPKDVEYPARVTKSTLTHQVVCRFKHSGVHRIFVVDDQAKPIGIISLVDIIDLFFRHIIIE